MLYFSETNIINNPKLSDLALTSSDIFKSRGVYTGDVTLTQFRILAYWGLFHRDKIEDPILFLESCADKIKEDHELIDLTVLCLNPSTANFMQAGFDLDESTILSTKFKAANYHFDPDDIQKIISWVGFTQSRVRHGSYKLWLHVTKVQRENGDTIDFNNFARFA